MACDDGNPCTRGEVFSSSCQCGGGTPLNGAPCGSGKVCQVGACTAAQLGTGAVILGQGPGGLLLIGTVVTPDEVVDGEVLIVGDEIKCVAPSCQNDPAVATASIIQTNGIIFPGLIDAHNHVQFDAFDETDWAPEPSDHFTNHYQWADTKRFRALDGRTGKELWQTTLDAVASAVPSTYLGHDGKQYVVVSATGSGFLQAPDSSDELIAFALK